MTCIDILANELDDSKTAEKFIAKLSGNANRVQAYIRLGKLKAAYLALIKMGNNDETTKFIEVIKSEALKVNDKATLDLCEKYISRNLSTQ